MFGRSGQMFPRRTFHDAIYEEEYGSDNEDECCRCRGLSAILCWFLSVIILVGLAATVVLTVFFILRSRTLMVKPDLDVDVELYGKDQSLYDSKGGGGASKELLGSNEVTTATSSSSSPKRKKSNTKGSGRGPPDATKNDVDADVNEDQNAINDSSEQNSSEGIDHEPDASVNHPRNHHPNHHTHQQHNRNRLQPYSPIKTTTTTSTTTTTTTPAPAAAEASEEENNESSSEEETDTEQNNGGGSSLFNLFSGPRNPSYSTPSINEDEEEEEDAEDDNNEDDSINTNVNAGNGVGISGESSLEYGNKVTRYSPDSAQVLFTESPKVTVTTSSPYGSRRNLQTTRFSTGRTSFTSTTTTTTQMPVTEEEEESEEEKKEEDGSDDNEEEENEEENEAEDRENNDEEKSSEEKLAPAGSSPQTTTSVYDGKGDDAGSESGENQLKQMLLDSIPPHGSKKDDVDGESTKDEEEEDGSDDEEMGGMSSSSEFNLSQKVRTTTEEPSTTTVKPVKTTKPPKQRGDTISRLISRNFTRKTTSTTTESSGSGSSETETQTDKPTATTVGPAGHKYDFTITPSQRGKVKTKSTESVEQEVTVSTKPPPKYTLKQRFRSTTVKPLVTPEPPSTAAPRTRGTSSPVTSTEFGIKQGAKRGSVESPIDIVPSPDLSPKGQLKQQLQKLKEQREKERQKNQPNSFEGVDLSSASSEEKGKTSSEQQFLDVLVGADDQKTLVTKKTEDGIVTSAILPPWYDSNGANSSISDVMAINGTTMSNTVAKVAEEDDALETSGENSFGEKMTIVKKKSSAEDKSPKNNSGASKEKDGPSEFERLVNMFSNQEQSSEDIPAPPPANRFGFKKQKPIVLKKPGGSLTSRFIRPSDPSRTNLFPSSSSSSSKETKSSENLSNGPSPSAASPEAEATTNLERPPGDVGRTGVLPTAADVEDPANMVKKYYPENGGDHDKVVVEQQHVESEPLASDETMDSPEEEQGNPSHVIDVNIDDTGDNPAEVIISDDTSAQLEDEEGDFVEDEDYNAYGDNPPTLSMSASAPNQNVVLPPDDYVLRGSGIRRPMSSEEFNEAPSDMDPSASSPVENSVSTTTTESPQVLSTPAPVAAIRRPAYTREEIAKAVVKPSPESLGENNLNDGNDHDHHMAATGSMEDEFEEEYEDDENYDGGSLEQPVGAGSLEHWSSERTGTPGSQKWSAPDKIMDAVEKEAKRPLTLSEELTEHEEHMSAESIAHPTVQHSVPLNSLENPSPHQPLNQVENSTKVFRPPQLVSFHENKLSFSPPAQLDGEYHSKDGWRPVLSNKTPGEGGLSSLEAVSGQVGSYEHEEDDHSPEHEHEEPQHLFQEPPQQQQPPQQPHVFQEPSVQQQPPHAFQEPSIEEQAHMFQEPPIQQQHQTVDPTPTQQIQPPPQQQWAQEQPSPPQLKHKQMMHRNPPPPPPQQHSVIPPPMPATIKFPDSEEDHEDRRHHGRRPRPGQGRFDRAKYMTRPAAPPIVMRRRPHAGGPFPPPPGLKNRQGPPPPHQGPPPPHQRPPPPQMMQQAGSQQNPQYALEHPPHPQSPPPPGRPPHPAINRNFHMRPNPMRRFNFGGGGGGPPQAQPRSGGNIKWPTDDGEVSRGEGENSSQQQNVEGAQSEVSINKRRRRRKRAVLAA